MEDFYSGGSSGEEAEYTGKWYVRSEIVTDFGNEEDARIFELAFLPEMGSMPLHRSAMEMKRKGSEIIFDLKAADITAFRATVNSVLQLLNIVKTLTAHLSSRK